VEGLFPETLTAKGLLVADVEDPLSLSEDRGYKEIPHELREVLRKGPQVGPGIGKLRNDAQYLLPSPPMTDDDRSASSRSTRSFRRGRRMIS
jgi:hypothetical protein